MMYSSLEQRMANAYLDMFPPFVPLASGPVSIQSQEQFYGFMKSFYQAYFDAPGQFFKALHEDDAYRHRYNRRIDDKPKLINFMKKVLAEIDGLQQVLFALGQHGTLRGSQLLISEALELKKKHLALLPCFGLRLENHVLSHDTHPDLFPAWQWMATREKATVQTFARCMFDPGHSYMEDIYRRLSGSPELFDSMAAHLKKNGYTCTDLHRGPYTLDYYKQTVDQEVPLGNPLHGDPYHYGLSWEYKPDQAIPQFMVLRIIEMKKLLLNFEQMPERVKGFTIKHAKKCDNCRYCTQTDKTGKRKKLAIEVMHDQPYEICPLYPGFNFTFTTLDHELAANLAAFLEFMNGQLLREENVGSRN